MPKSWSRTITGFDVPHLLPVNSRVVDVVDVGLERRLEAVLPALERREDGNVVGRQRVLARAEHVAELAEVDELHDLRLADDELRAALDFLVVVGKADTTACRASRRSTR